MTKALQYVWTADADVTGDGVLMTFTFDIPSGTAAGDYNIGFILRRCYNNAEQNVSMQILGGNVTVLDFIYGDANGDNVIDGRDVIMLKNYLANYNYDAGTSTVELFPGADATGNDEIDGRDVIRLKNYIANYNYDTGTSTVILGPA